MSRLVVVVLLLVSTVMAMNQNPRQVVEQLNRRYAELLNSQRIEKLVNELFAPDAIIAKQSPRGLRIKAIGHDQILEGMKEQIGNIVIDTEIDVEYVTSDGRIIAGVTTTIFHSYQIRRAQYKYKQFINNGKIVFLVVEDPNA